MRFLLAVHLVCTALAATSYTLVTWPFGKTAFQFCYYHYSSSTGFGTEYVSPFSMLEIYTYVAAFATGTVAYALLSRRSKPYVAVAGLVTSIVGLASFINECLQLAQYQHASWIAFSPILMLALATIALLPQSAPQLSQTSPANNQLPSTG